MVINLRYCAPKLWQNAKCLAAGYEDDQAFFPEEERNPDYGDAIEFCNGTSDGVECPIRHECLLFALTNNEKIGVWGGTEPVTRRAIRKKWPLRRGKEPRPEWRWMSKEDATSLVNGKARHGKEGKSNRKAQGAS